jgi:uncharacterized protein (AIM24 family)
MREGVQRGSVEVGGFGKMIGRALGGQSLFLVRYKGLPGFPSDASRSVTFASSTPGDVLHLRMRPGERWTISRDSYLAGSPNVTVSGRLNWRGAFEVGQEEGLVLPSLECAATVSGGPDAGGCAWLASYGRFKRHELLAGQTLLVDNGLFLACSSSGSPYKVTRLGKSWTSSLLGGEGLGMQFDGPAIVYTQSHNFNDLAALVASRMPDGGGGAVGIGAAVGLGAMLLGETGGGGGGGGNGIVRRRPVAPRSGRRPKADSNR